MSLWTNFLWRRHVSAEKESEVSGMSKVAKDWTGEN